MTQPASSDIKSSYPPNNALRIGTASIDSSTNEVKISVQGVQVQAGFLNPGGIVQDGPVAVLRGEASWLALGGISTPPRTLYAACDNNLVLTTLAQTVSGTTITAVTAGTTPYHAIAVFDTDISVAAVTTVLGQLAVDGTAAAAPNVIGSSSTAVVRFTLSQQWVGTLAAGTHTFALQALKTVNAGTITIRASHTTLTVRLG